MPLLPKHLYVPGASASFDAPVFLQWASALFIAAAQSSFASSNPKSEAKTVAEFFGLGNSTSKSGAPDGRFGNPPRYRAQSAPYGKYFNLPDFAAPFGASARTDFGALSGAGPGRWESAHPHRQNSAAAETNIAVFTAVVVFMATVIICAPRRTILFPKRRKSALPGKPTFANSAAPANLPGRKAPSPANFRPAAFANPHLGRRPVMRILSLILNSTPAIYPDSSELSEVNPQP